MEVPRAGSTHSQYPHSNEVQSGVWQVLVRRACRRHATKGQKSRVFDTLVVEPLLTTPYCTHYVRLYGVTGSSCLRHDYLAMSTL